MRDVTMTIVIRGRVQEFNDGIDNARDNRMLLDYITAEHGVALDEIRSLLSVEDDKATVDIEVRNTFSTEEPARRHVDPYATARGRLSEGWS